MKTKLRLIIPMIVAVIAIAAAVLFIGFKPQNKSDISSLFTTAQKYLVENKYEQAIAEFNKILELDPQNADAYLGLAEAYEFLGDMELAAQMRQYAAELLNNDMSETYADEQYPDEFENIYNENGLLKCEYVKDENGSVIGRYFYYYFQSGDLSEKKYCDIINSEAGSISDIMRSDTRYYENGQIAWLKEYYENGSRSQELYYSETGIKCNEYRYDENDALIYHAEFSSEDGDICSEEIYDYENDKLSEVEYSIGGVKYQLYEHKISDEEYKYYFARYDDGAVAREDHYENGNKIDCNTYYSNGNFETVEKFDASGNKIYQAGYDENGDMRYYDNIEYYPGSDMCKYIVSYSYGIIDDENYYDESGFKVKEVRYDDDGTLDEIREYKKDPNGESVFHTYADYYKSGNIHWIHYYDDYGIEIKEISYEDDGSISRVTEYKNVDSKSVKQKGTSYYKDGSISAVVTYDNKGIEIKSISYGNNGETESVTEYENIREKSVKRKEIKYNKEGLLYKETSYEKSIGKREN